MKLSDKLKARRGEVSDAMKGMVDTLATENRDFSVEERTAFDKLKGEKESLATRIADAEAAEGADRNAEGRAIDGGDDRQLAEGAVRALLPEQRMASLLPHREGPTLNLRNLVRGQVFGDWKGADAERRAMGENTGALGGFLVPDSLSASIIDLARNKSVVVPAGALTINMPTPEMTVVKVKTDPTPYWRGEHQPITESAPTFEPVRLKAMAVAALVRISVELLEDAPQAAQTVENVLAAAMALEVDRVGLFGNGTTEPRGLFNTDGVNLVSMGTNGATPGDYDEYLDAITAIENANGVPGAIIMSPRTKRTLAGLKTGISGDKTPLTPPKEFTDLRRLVSNQIPTNLTQGSATTTSASAIGDFSQMALAMRTGLIMEATRDGGTDAFAKMQVLIRCYLRMDVAVFRPTHFTKLTGIKA
jgi:HK97 family phage major capsid protein